MAERKRHPQMDSEEVFGKGLDPDRKKGIEGRKNNLGALPKRRDLTEPV